LTSIHTSVVLWRWDGLWIASHSRLCINGANESGRLRDACSGRWGVLFESINCEICVGSGKKNLLRQFNSSPPPPHGATAPTGPGPFRYRGFTITLRHTTHCRSPLDDWSARRRETSKGGSTLVTLPRIVTPYRDSVDGTRARITYQKLVTP